MWFFMIMKKVFSVAVIISVINLMASDGNCSHCNINKMVEDYSSGTFSFDSKQLNLQSNTQVPVYKKPVIKDSFTNNDIKPIETFQNENSKIYLKKLINKKTKMTDKKRNCKIINNNKSYLTNNINKIDDTVQDSHSKITRFGDNVLKKNINGISNERNNDIVHSNLSFIEYGVRKESLNSNSNKLICIDNKEYELNNGLVNSNSNMIPIELVVDNKDNSQFLIEALCNNIQQNENFTIKQNENFTIKGINNAIQRQENFQLSGRSHNYYNANVNDEQKQKDNKYNNKNIGSLDTYNHVQDGIIENIGKINIEKINVNIIRKINGSVNM